MATAPSYPMPPGGGVPVGYTPGQQPPGAAMQGQTVVVTAPVRYGQNPTNMTCYHCQAQILTTTSKKPGVAGNIKVFENIYEFLSSYSSEKSYILI